MITVKATNLDAAFSKIEAWLQEQERMLVQVAIGLAYKAFDIVLSNSPQYSGDFTANWKLSVNKMDVSFRENVFPEMQYPVPEGKKPFQRGDIAAIMHAIGERTPSGWPTAPATTSCTPSWSRTTSSVCGR
jgi:hypothetical protein